MMKWSVRRREMVGMTFNLAEQSCTYVKLIS